LHGTQKLGSFWAHVQYFEDRQFCETCDSTESMSHILINCRTPAVGIIWNLAKNIWPHENRKWPTMSLGMILGCGSITTIPAQPPQTDAPQNRRSSQTGMIRLLQILITESAHLIWVLRCERVIQRREHGEREICTRWLNAINKRLIDDKITAAKIKRDKTTCNKVRATWEQVLKKQGDVPNNWISYREFLVGMRVRSRPVAGPP